MRATAQKKGRGARCCTGPEIKEPDSGCLISLQISGTSGTSQAATVRQIMKIINFFMPQPFSTMTDPTE